MLEKARGKSQLAIVPSSTVQELGNEATMCDGPGWEARITQARPLKAWSCLILDNQQHDVCKPRQRRSSGTRLPSEEAWGVGVGVGEHTSMSWGLSRQIMTLAVTLASLNEASVSNIRQAGEQSQSDCCLQLPFFVYPGREGVKDGKSRIECFR